LSGFKKNAAGLAAFAVLVLVLPYLLPNEYYVNTLIFAFLNAIIVVGLNLLMGYAGQISLGQAAFYGLGAYTSGILTAKYGINPWAAILAGIFLSATVAVIVGSPSLKLSGHYLAMATLAFGEIIYIIFNQSVSLTGGPDGFGNIPHLSLFGFTFDSILANYYLIWAVAIAMLIFTLNIIHSRVGRALRSIHGSEVAAMTMGVNAARYKIQVFITSAIMASIAGSLYAHYVQFINPPVFDLFYSIKLLMMVVIGGMTSVWGALIGAALMTFLPEWLIVLEDFDVLAYGFVLLLIIMFLPNGLFSLPNVLHRLITPRLRSRS